MSACTRFDDLGWGKLETDDWAGVSTSREEDEELVSKTKKLIKPNMTRVFHKRPKKDWRDLDLIY